MRRWSCRDTIITTSASKPLDGITYVVRSGSSARICTRPKSRARRPAKFAAGRDHYGLVDVYADHLAVRVLNLDDQVIDEFAVALRPTEHAPGTARNLTATELPPIDTLPAYREERLGLRPGARRSCRARGERTFPYCRGLLATEGFAGEE